MVTKASVDAVLDKIDGFVAAEMDHFGSRARRIPWESRR
jgi:hypothetical protein